MAVPMDVDVETKLPLPISLPSSGDPQKDFTLNLGLLAALTTPAVHTICNVADSLEEHSKPKNRTSLTAGDLTVARMDWYAQFEDTHNEFRKNARMTLSELRALCSAIGFEFAFDVFEGHWKYSNAVRSGFCEWR